MALNTVALMGRITFEPELKATNSGKSVIRFQIAADRNYQAKGQERQADFIDCIAWDRTADFISKYFNKGSMIALTGSIQTTNFTDKDGNKRKSVEVNVSNVSFCGNKEKATEGGTAPSGNIEMLDDDDKMPWED